MKRAALVISLGLLTLTGCSSGDMGNPVWDIVREKAKAGAQKLKTPRRAKRPTAISPEQLKGITTPIIEVRIEKTDAFAALAPVRENAGAVTWFTADKIGLTFRHGILIRSQGLGADLFAADIAGTVDALSHKSKNEFRRVHRYMDDENHMVSLTFTCNIENKGQEEIGITDRTHQTIHLIERCKNETVNFANAYWASARSGKIIQSRQWVGSDLGFLFIQRLIE